MSLRQSPIRSPSRLLQKIKEYLSQPKELYCDATYDVKNKVACIGFCNKEMTKVGTKYIRAENVNEAEHKAVEFALEKHPNAIIYTDSMAAVAALNIKTVYHIPRAENIANLIVRSGSEMSKSKVEHSIK